MKMLLSLIFLAPASALLAHSSPDDVTPARFPDADVVILEETERVKYTPEGTYESVCEEWKKILTEKGRRDASTIDLTYSRRYGAAGILSVAAISTNGVERMIDVAATTKEATDNDSMGANIYDPLDRRIVCTIPGLKIGETLHVKIFRRAEKARCVGHWADLSVMEWTHPILKSVYEITAPAARPLAKVAIRNPLGNVIAATRRLDDGSTLHTFTATNVPRMFPEPDMPQLYTQVQNIRVSTDADWPAISTWYWELSRPHLTRTSAAMTNKVAELLAEAGADSDTRLRAIFRFVSQEIRYMGLTMEDTSPGYAPHDVDVTFDNRYGVCRDKAALLVALLRIAGFEAYPVLIQVGAKLDPEVPQPFFNHAIACVVRPDGAGYELMDPTNENTKDLFPAYLSNRSYLVCRPEGAPLQTSPVPSPLHNSLDVISTGSLAKDGAIFLETDLAFSGINDTAYRSALARRTPENRVQLFERIVRNLATGAELVRCDIRPKDMRDTTVPVRVRLATRLPESILRGETRDELTVPFFSRALGVANFLFDSNTSLSQRKYTLALDTTARVHETLDIDVAEALGDARTLPANVVTTGGYAYARTFAVTNGHLLALRDLTIGAVEFSPAEYLDLRENIKDAEAAERPRPLFNVDRLKDADVRTIFDSSETTLFDDRSWVTTNTSVKEVLTYAGKKGEAELKFTYNPTWQSVRVLSASVSNRTGRIAVVTPREMNEMDCGWASAAPRYPASKVLVVNLPSVEIGSVISVQTVHTASNAPTAFYRTFFFDSTEPVDQRIVRVNGWRREVVRPKRLPNEPNAAPAVFWRDVVTVSSNRFARLAERLRGIEPPPLAVPFELPEKDDAARVKTIRDWMARFVKITGPGLYDLPIDLQLTDPTVVLRERYATRLDYVRTLTALLKGAGYDAHVVLAAANADDCAELRRRAKEDYPNPRAFASALCRVSWREGGFWGLGGETRTLYVGTENQYAELGATAFEKSDCFDPADATFNLVTVPRGDLASDLVERRTIDVLPSGAVDMTIEHAIRGSGVAAFRKRYVEILPEDRFRRHQEILGEISQAATATGDLETDVTGYPATRRLTCHIPDYATVSDDALTIRLAGLLSSVPTFTGTARQTPFAIGASDPQTLEVTVRFPEGFVAVENKPEDLTFEDPLEPGRVWMTSRTTASVEGNSCVVRVVRHILPRVRGWYAAKYAELMKDWNRRANGRARATITVRRK